MTFDLWPSDLKTNGDHLLTKDYIPTKFEASWAKRSRVISCTRWSKLAWPLTLTFDRLTLKSIGIIYSPRTIYLASLKLLGQSVIELSVAQGEGRPTYRPTDRRTDRPTDRQTDMCKAIYPAFSKGGGHNNKATPHTFSRLFSSARPPTPSLSIMLECWYSMLFEFSTTFKTIQIKELCSHIFGILAFIKKQRMIKARRIKARIMKARMPKIWEHSSFSFI